MNFKTKILSHVLQDIVPFGAIAQKAHVHSIARTAMPRFSGVFHIISCVNLSEEENRISGSKKKTRLMMNMPSTSTSSIVTYRLTEIITDINLFPKIISSSLWLAITSQ